MLSETDLRYRYIGSVIIVIVAGLLQVTYLLLPSLATGNTILASGSLGPGLILGLLGALFSLVWSVCCIIVLPLFWAYYVVYGIWLRRWRAAWLILTLPLGIAGPTLAYIQLISIQS